MKTLLRTASISVLAIAAFGCTAPPTAIDPAVDLPANFSTAPQQGAQEWPAEEWWKSFGSDELSSLEATALASNLDIDSALARLTAAQAANGSAFAPLLPSATATVGVARGGPNQDTGATAATNTQNTESTRFSVGYSGLDLLGTINSLRAARENERSSLYSYGSQKLAISASVATAYFNILALRERIAFAKQNIANAEAIMTTVQAKVSAGVSDNLALASQQASLAGQRSTVPTLQEQEREARYALAILLGRAPEGFDVKATSLDGIVPPPVAPGMPAVLLTRRPDIAIAEANLFAQHANVDKARAAFLPLTLTATETGSTGGAGAAAANAFNFAKLFDPTTLAWNIGASLLVTIFDGGRLHYASVSAQASERQLVNTYRTTVFNALSDVETQLGQVNSQTLSFGFVNEQLTAQTEAERIAELQYREGVTALTDLLTAQNSLYGVRGTVVTTKQSRLNAFVNLYKALGGGWTMDGADKSDTDLVGWSPL